MGVISLTTGVPGSGKTYLRCARFLVDDFLINNRRVKHISNFPVRKEETAKEVFLRQRGLLRLLFSSQKPESLEEIMARIEIIPNEVLQTWRSEQSGPWEYFKDRDINGCHIAIDEFHEFLGKLSSDAYVRKWEDWLATIRHLGCTIEALTQDASSVNPVYTHRVSERYELISAEDMTDPYLGIKIKDWAELKAGFSGKYTAYGQLWVKQKQASGRFKIVDCHLYAINDYYFKFYDSFNDTKKDELTSDVPRHEYQKRSLLGLVFWFLTRNIYKIIFRLAILALVLWLTFGGGIKMGIAKFMKFTETIATKNMDVGSRIRQSKKQDTPKDDIVVPEEQIFVPPPLEKPEKMPDEQNPQIEKVDMEQPEEDDLEYIRLNERKIVLLTKDYAILDNGQRVRLYQKIKFENGKAVLNEINCGEYYLMWSDNSISVMCSPTQNRTDSANSGEGGTPKK